MSKDYSEQCAQCLSNKADGALWEEINRDENNPDWVNGGTLLCESCAAIHLEGQRREFPGIVVEFRRLGPPSPERK